MKKYGFLIVALGLSMASFAQTQIPPVTENTVQDSVLRSNTPVLFQPKDQIQATNKINLQDFVEDLYINSCKLYHNGALPLIDKGDYMVVMIDKKKDISKAITSKDLAELSLDKIKEMHFEKSKQTDVLYGNKGGVFGVVVITLN